MSYFCKKSIIFTWNFQKLVAITFQADETIFAFSEVDYAGKI